MEKIIIGANSGWTLSNFRFELIRKLIDTGFEVVLVAGSDEYLSRLEALGCRYIPLKIDIIGTNIYKDFLVLLQFCYIFFKERPDFFLGFTIKPNIYGSIAARLCGVFTINNINGLGSIFNRENWLTKFVISLYRIALKKSRKVFFQNNNNRLLFLKKRIVKSGITDLLPGSGVDLKRFSYAEMPRHHDPADFRFLLLARMLWDKGVGEYVEVAKIIKKKYPKVEFWLLGFLDVQSPSAISRHVMDEWVAEGSIKYLGTSDSVGIQIALADCIVLPSYYREGVPRALLEAAAIGRPIITTDTVGCREVVDENVNGFLCNPRDTIDLAKKIEMMVCLPKDTLAMMSKKSRDKAVNQFDEIFVIDKYLSVINNGF